VVQPRIRDEGAAARLVMPWHIPNYARFA
jgi:hypothetical protein